MCSNAILEPLLCNAMNVLRNTASTVCGVKSNRISISHFMVIISRFTELVNNMFLFMPVMLCPKTHSCVFITTCLFISHEP